jgi:hypothetical protein
MKLSSNKVLRELATKHNGAQQSLQDFRRLIGHGVFTNFFQRRGFFAIVDDLAIALSSA